jgi:hypothetical protein
MNRSASSVQKENHREVVLAQLHRQIRKDLWDVLIVLLCSELFPRLCDTVQDEALGTL